MSIGLSIGVAYTGVALLMGRRILRWVINLDGKPPIEWAEVVLTLAMTAIVCLTWGAWLGPKLLHDHVDPQRLVAGLAGESRELRRQRRDKAIADGELDLDL